MKTPEKYTSLRVGVHWSMVLLLVAVYAAMELRDFFPKGSSAKEGLETWHFMLGLSVLLLVVLRLLARWTQPGPPEVQGAAWQMWLAKAIHLGLYVFMFGMPLAGWLILSTAGKPVPFFGLELPALMGPDKTLSGQIKDVHEVVATIGYFMIGLHALGALFHHYFLKDNTLRRMWL